VICVATEAQLIKKSVKVTVQYVDEDLTSSEARKKHKKRFVIIGDDDEENDDV
jgi:RNase H-fold protein (predicted Holliday junction resolvase)